MIYLTTLLVRNFLYRHNIKKTVKAPVPTICVGNITVGGTGKTPMTELILRELLASDRWGDRQIAMLSRGYRRRSKGYQEVNVLSTSDFAGDEPLQVKRKFPEVTVAVDKDRVEGCGILAGTLSQESGGRSAKKRRKAAAEDRVPSLPADIIVLDDAFQYRRLDADLKVILVNYNRPVSRDHLLPFGRLRDLRRRLREADVIVVTKCPAYMEDEERIDFARTLGFKYYNPAKFQGTTAKGENQTVLFSTVRYGRSVPMFEESDPRYIYSKKLVLFSGIADDAPFMRTMSDSYRIVGHLHFPDHHRYGSADIRSILSCVRTHPTAAVGTTEKDAQRVRDVKGLPSELVQRMFYVPIEAAFLTEEEAAVFREKLLSL